MLVSRPNISELVYLPLAFASRKDALAFSGMFEGAPAMCHPDRSPTFRLMWLMRWFWINTCSGQGCARSCSWLGHLMRISTLSYVSPDYRTSTQRGFISGFFCSIPEDDISEMTNTLTGRVDSCSFLPKRSRSRWLLVNAQDYGGNSETTFWSLRALCWTCSP